LKDKIAWSPILHRKILAFIEQVLICQWHIKTAGKNLRV